MNLDSAELKIYIYKSGGKPSSPQYTLSKSKISNDSVINFEISELIKDYIDVSFDGSYGLASFTAFVDTELTRTFKATVSGTEVTKTDATPLTRKFLAFRGYGELEDENLYLTAPYYGKNINPTLSKDVLISNRKIYHKKGEPLYVPFYTTTDGVNQVKFFDGTTELTSQIYGGSVSNIRADKADVYADNFTGALDYYSADMTFRRNENADDTTKTAVGGGTTTRVVYTTPTGVDVTIPVEEIEECKYTSYKVTFLNKFGALQDLWFFKKRVDSFSTNRESYNRNILINTTTGVDYSRFSHTSSLLDVSSEESFVMNTGFISEDHNEVIKQLMVTEYAWVHEQTNFDFEPVPIVPKTSSFTSKTALNDKLINFEVEFEYANSYIQNVR